MAEEVSRRQAVTSWEREVRTEEMWERRELKGAVGENRG